MSVVFLLGAGFSKAASGIMPLLGELSQELAAGSLVPPDAAALGGNVEDWLTYLSQPQPWNTEAKNLRNKADFLDLTQAIGSVIRNREQERDRPCPEWLKSLIHWWHYQHSTVITLNYDTLIERAVQTTGLVLPEYLYPVILQDVRRTEYPRGGPVPTFTLCKLHGSVNWFYSGAESYYGETIYSAHVQSWNQENPSDEDAIFEAAADKIPLIAPPTAEKVAYFQHEILRRIWSVAAQALKSADKLVCIGYSLPITDLSIQFFLKSSRPDHKIPLVIVNKSSNIQEHYEGLLAESYIIESGHFGDNAVLDFVDGLTDGSC